MFTFTFVQLANSAAIACTAAIAGTAAMQALLQLHVLLQLQVLRQFLQALLQLQVLLAIVSGAVISALLKGRWYGTTRKGVRISDYVRGHSNEA